MPAPNTSTSACDGPKVNVVEELSEFAGDWGGSCTCPDGQIYEVGDNNWKGCGQIACVGGVAGKCSEFKGPWSRRRVFCAPCPEEVKPQPPAVTAPAPKEDDRGLCTDVDTTVGIAARSSFGGFCCKFCQGGKSICCPSKDGETGEDISLRIENTEETRVNLCCGEGDMGGGAGCVGRQAHSIIMEQLGPADMIHMVVTNVSTYFPVFPQRIEGAGGHTHPHDPIDFPPDKPSVLPERLDSVASGYEGWLANGLKHHSEEHNVTTGLMQLNQCNDRIVTAQVCFVDGDYKPLHMRKTRLRVLDLDMGKDPERKGPQTVQFHCPGGTFEVYGDTPPYVSWTAGAPVEVQKDAGHHGLSKYTYKCPADDLVTVWARMDGTLDDDPESAAPVDLTREQQKRTLLIEYHDTECTNLTFASMPPFYRQLEGNGGSGWDLSQRGDNGGNPLNTTRRLTYEAFDGLVDGPCSWDGRGRNIFIAGSYDESDPLDCDLSPPPPPTPQADISPPPSTRASPAKANPYSAPSTSAENPSAAPPTVTACKSGSRTNVVKTNAKGVGAWGGSCTCPDGSEYPAGDLVTINSCTGVQHLGLLACYGGKPGKINRFEGNWSGNKVDCHVCDDCEGPYQNIFSEANDWHSNVGAWGGECTCPDGQVYLVGDQMDSSTSAGGTLACEGGTPGEINHERGPWSGNSVICSSCPGPLPLPSPCEGKTKNVVTNNDTKVGSFGGDCTCPDGEVYQVGDVYLGAEPTLACFGGTPGAYHARHGLWSHVKVQCGACDVCGGPAANVYNEHDPSAGGWGGQCACPDGQIYDVGDNYDEIQSLKCVGGVWNVKDLNKFEGEWSRKSVVCSPCPVGGDTSHLTGPHKGGAGPSKCS
jgi:hypothetical protein